MKIGGFQKNSLIDFPETIACVVFTVGCNFICPYCHNPELVSTTEIKKNAIQIKEEEIFFFLEKRKKLVDGVVITGGEPTLHKDLENFCFKIKNMGYLVKLDTNGTNPLVLKNLIQKQLLDFIAMDIKTSLKAYFLVAGKKINTELIKESIELIIEKAPLYEFRTTCVRPYINKKIIFDIGEMIKGASNYILQQCSTNVKVLNPEFLKNQKRFFSNKEMIELKILVQKNVKKCLIR
ncbi:MAG: anaerobic ribonucleoside-triphosphate reductase activating protein [Desulfobacteraceae bacterium 4572_130]|nr:MAG: anaerobic ribonucleoside-triphosphate reductase activating protein [Desulfobacteraceae bacterium 4572_130]